MRRIVPDQTSGAAAAGRTATEGPRLADDGRDFSSEALEALPVGVLLVGRDGIIARVNRECERLFVDSIAAARQSIYLESQYFTNDALARALAARLQEPEGPEIIVVIPKECHGWIEQQTMGALRDEALRHLITSDRWRRLRVVYPAASRARDVCTFIHSKVMIVDTGWVKVESA